MLARGSQHIAAYYGNANSVLDLIFFVIIIIISLLRVIARASHRSEYARSEASTTNTTIAGPRRRCGTCGSVMMVPNSRFCPICGAPFFIALPTANPEPSQTGIGGVIAQNLQPPPQQESKVLSPVRKAKAASQRTCMVCELTLAAGDSLAYCPHCGNPAHSVHLLEWLHVKDYCPMCHQHLDEREIKQQMDYVKNIGTEGGDADSRDEKRIGKRTRFKRPSSSSS